MQRSTTCQIHFWFLFSLLSIVYSATSDCIRSALKCDDIKFEGQLWGHDVFGIMIGQYTNIQFIGCVGSTEINAGCNINEVFCSDDDSKITVAQSIFPPKPLISLFDTDNLPDTDTGCATETNVQGFSHLRFSESGIELHTLCQQLGYERNGGFQVASDPSTYVCPRIHLDTQSEWFLNFSDVSSMSLISGIVCANPCKSGSPTQSPTQNPTHETQSPTHETQSPTQNPTQNPTHETQTPTHETQNPTHETQTPTQNPTHETQTPTQNPIDSDSSSSSNEMSSESTEQTIINAESMKNNVLYDNNNAQKNDKILVEFDFESCLILILLLIAVCSFPFSWYFIIKK